MQSRDAGQATSGEIAHAQDNPGWGTLKGFVRKDRPEQVTHQTHSLQEHIVVSGVGLG